MSTEGDVRENKFKLQQKELKLVRTHSRVTKLQSYKGVGHS